MQCKLPQSRRLAFELLARIASTTPAVLDSLWERIETETARQSLQHVRQRPDDVDANWERSWLSLQGFAGVKNQVPSPVAKLVLAWPARRSQGPMHHARAPRVI
jgi:hypothetical protein